MSFWAKDDAIDAALEYIGACDRMFLCSQQPTNYTEASVTYCLATIVLKPLGESDQDFSISNGDVSGRKLTLAEISGTGSDDGVANHVGFGLNGSSDLRFVSTMTNLTVENGVGFTVPSKDVWEIRDPA